MALAQPATALADRRCVRKGLILEIGMTIINLHCNRHCSSLYNHIAFMTLSLIEAFETRSCSQRKPSVSPSTSSSSHLSWKKSCRRPKLEDCLHERRNAMETRALGFRLPVCGLSGVAHRIKQLCSRR